LPDWQEGLVWPTLHRNVACDESTFTPVLVAVDAHARYMKPCTQLVVMGALKSWL
jgi:hypothetical protein